MAINRSNYEIWFIDWIDGKLDDFQIEELIRFLKGNPDLEEEFAEISAFKLKAPEKDFPHKNILKKSPANVSDSQFKHLCIAFAEKDLSEEQCAELKEIIDRDTEKRSIFELFQKTKLSPAPVSYKGKKLLFRRTIGQNFTRLVIITLSAAAVIIFGIISFNSKPNLLPHKLQTTAQIMQSSAGNSRNLSYHLDVSKKIIADAGARITGKSLNRVSQSAGKSNVDRNLSTQQDSVPAQPIRSSIVIEKITVSTEIYVGKSEIPLYLVASQSTINMPEYDDGQSKFSKFIAKAFREKLLREKTPKDSPLKGYEVAKAGITGLNFLLGWEMALDEKKDETGKLKSVYFSSRILKFNAPVNKVETAK